MARLVIHQAQGEHYAKKWAGIEKKNVIREFRGALECPGNKTEHKREAAALVVAKVELDEKDASEKRILSLDTSSS